LPNGLSYRAHPRLYQLRHCNCSRRAPVHKATIDAIDELAEKIWDLEGDLLEALSLF